MESQLLIQILNILINAIKDLFNVVVSVASNPWASIILGGILAFGARYIIWGIGLALIVYGVVTIVAEYFGIKLIPTP